MSDKKTNTGSKLDWKFQIVPKIKEILTDRRDKGINTATLRGIFYILVSLDILENLQERYKSLSKALVTARRSGAIPVDWIVDESREINIDDQYLEPGEEIMQLLEWLNKLPDEYINSIPRWHNQPKYIEIWIEKNAMAGVFSSILTESRQVRIVPNGGAGLPFHLKVRTSRDFDITSQMVRGYMFCIMVITIHQVHAW